MLFIFFLLEYSKGHHLSLFLRVLFLIFASLCLIVSFWPKALYYRIYIMGCLPCHIATFSFPVLLNNRLSGSRKEEIGKHEMCIYCEVIWLHLKW